MITTLLRGALLAITMLALVGQSVAAQAQTVPGGSVNTTVVPGGAVHVPEVTDEIKPIAVHPGEAVVFIGDVATCEPAKPQDINRYTRAMGKTEYLQRCPERGEEGWTQAVELTKDGCGEGNAVMAELLRISGGLDDSKLTYQDLQDLFSKLPRDMKRHAGVVTVAYAASTGALCALTAGLYCIAALASGVGNIIGVHGSLKMQLMNIRLSQANIQLTLQYIDLAKVNIRATATWVKFSFPACQFFGYNEIAPDWTSGQ